jgi:hypothetical protein
LYSRVADSKQKWFGGSISTTLAKAFHDLPQFGVLISDVLYCHSKMFDFVACENNVIIIGNPNGSVKGYKERRLLFDERIASGNIEIVDIGPGCRFAAAICFEKDTAFLLRLIARKGFIRKKSLVVWHRTITPVGRKIQIVWVAYDDFKLLPM